ncbi:BRCA1-associated RING domain protein 1-like, partial [Octopus sinensis]|uniref:BRCA1-associated RING domain protein 1-like n=1 Tax=Octopus sinensis TaxID=2607531 RepID=A0A6P7U394_9MOLL
LEVSANLCSLGICEHLVCRQCLDKGINGNCPICRLPFDAKDVKDQLLVCNLVDLCKQLGEIVYNPTAVSSDDDDDNNTKTREDTIYSLSSRSTSNKSEVIKPISIKSSETSALSLFAHELDKQSQEAIFNQTPENLPPKKLRSLERKNISKVAKTSFLPNKKPCITKYKSKSSLKHLNLLNVSDSSLRCSFSRFSNKGRKRSAPALVNLASPEPKWKSPQTKKTRSPAIMKKNAKGETPLHVAVIKVFEIVEQLMNKVCVHQHKW